MESLIGGRLLPREAIEMFTTKRREHSNSQRGRRRQVHRCQVLRATGERGASANLSTTAAADEDEELTTSLNWREDGIFRRRNTLMENKLLKLTTFAAKTV